MQVHKLVLIALAPLATSAAATAAPWYVWQFRVDNIMTAQTACAQIVSGTWVQISGPFRDANCTIPIGQ